MTEVGQGTVYQTYAPAPPQGQQQPAPYPTTGPGYPVPQLPAPRRPRNLFGVLGAVVGTVGLVCGVVALIVTLTRPAPPAPTPAPTAAQPFMFSPEVDKQWCISMRPLLAERMDMTPAEVISNGPGGREYRNFASWVGGWSERMTTAMNQADHVGGGLDRTARRAVDMTVAVSFIKDDSWWNQDARYVFNDAAETSTTVNAYCRSVGEPVRP